MGSATFFSVILSLGSSVELIVPAVIAAFMGLAALMSKNPLTPFQRHRELRQKDHEFSLQLLNRVECRDDQNFILEELLRQQAVFFTGMSLGRVERKILSPLLASHGPALTWREIQQVRQFFVQRSCAENGDVLFVHLSNVTRRLHWIAFYTMLIFYIFLGSSIMLALYQNEPRTPFWGIVIALMIIVLVGARSFLAPMRAHRKLAAATGHTHRDAEFPLVKSSACAPIMARTQSTLPVVVDSNLMSHG